MDEHKNYNFSIFYDNGNLIYKTGDSYIDKNMLGIIQSLFITCN